MSNLTRWEPMREMMTLREAMDRLFDDAFTRPFSSVIDGTAPAIDLYQTNDSVVVKAALPGLKADEVQLSVSGDVLTLKGEFHQNDDIKEATYHLREQRYGSFERSVMLPTEVDSEKAKAEFENGVLTVTIPKAAQARPKTITIKPKSG
jgi:HSP20 family protein